MMIQQGLGSKGLLPMYRMIALIAFACALSGFVPREWGQPSSVHAQEEAPKEGEQPAEAPKKSVEQPLVEQEPHDRITITQEAGGDVVKVALLPFPNRVVPPRPAPTEKLVVVWLERPEEEFEIAWGDIEKIELYEQMVIVEAEKTAAANDFTSTFRLMQYLYRNYPDTPNLETMRRKFILRNGAYQFSQKQYAHAFTIFEELNRTAPGYEAEKVKTALSRLANALIEQNMAEGNLTGAQRFLRRVETDYGNMNLESVALWRAKFSSMAKEKMDQARTFKEQGNLRDALRVANEMIAIWPELEGGKALLDELVMAYPMLRFGVMQKSVDYDPSSLLNWGSRRGGSLLQRSLFEMRKVGSEGGDYVFPLGSFSRSEDYRELTFTISNSLANTPLDAFGIGQWLIDRADPESPQYSRSWGAIARDVVVESPTSMRVRLRNPNVLPHSFLQWPLPEQWQTAASNAGALKLGNYVVGPQTENETSFVFRPGVKAEPRQPVEIVEHFYDEAAEAVNDLLRGEIDGIDQVFPADARELKKRPDLMVSSYALPTLHILVPRKTDHPFMKKTQFRRALLYAVNRQSLLSNELLGGVPGEGQLISGPFPAGIDANDPLAYAYDVKVQPYPYEPRLAKLLVTLTERELTDAAKKAKEPPPKLTEVRLGVPQTEVARVAGEAMVQQWIKAGIPAKLVVLPPGQVIDTDNSCDLVYMTAAVWEPVTDVERLLGADSVASTDNPFVVQALGSLRDSGNWQQVNARTHALHRLVHYHLPILPLWQVTDSFVVRNTIDGVATRPVSLYQDSSRWRLK